MVKRKDRLSFQNDRNTLIALSVCGILDDPLKTVDPVQCKKSRRNIKIFRFVKPPTWDRATPLIKATYATIVLAEKGASYSFSLRFGVDKLLKLKSTNRGPIDHIRREVHRVLKQTLGYDVPFWLHADIGQRGMYAGGYKSLHVHGVIGISEQEAALVRPNLLKISGGFDRRRALDIKLVFESINIFLGPGDHAVRNTRSMTRMIPGALYSCNRKLNASACALYNDHRSEFIQLNKDF